MAQLENPADQLSTIVVRLFQLAGDTRIKPKSKRDRIFLAAHKLHGYSSALAQRQFSERTAKYNRLLQIEEELGSSAQYAGSDYRLPGFLER